MLQPNYTHDSTPWYRQRWPWLLISLPASAVIGGVITLVLALQSPNALVVDDYYKAGLAINQQKQRLAAAAAQGLSGLLRSDGKRLELYLNNPEQVTEAVLTLQIIHATRAELDRELTLQRQVAGHYAAEQPLLSRGTWYLHLYPQSKAWEIRSRVNTDGSFQAHLTPQS